MIPLVHDFSDEVVLVFGGGPVGARKARRFAREARVVVVSPGFAADDFGGAERIQAAPRENDVGTWLDRLKPALVVAATDDQSVNEAVETAATDRRILVNRADVAGPRRAGSVVVPATVRDGPVVVAVSTEATAPALTRGLRVRLEEQLVGSERVAHALETVAATLDHRGVDPDTERQVLRAVAASPAVWEATADGSDVEAVALDIVEESVARVLRG